MISRILALATLGALALAQSGGYTGPRPPKPDIPYLLHATNLVQTEVAEAKEESRKNETLYAISGAASPVKTPLAEPIFLYEAQKVQPERLQMYKLESKNGRREIVMRAKKGQRPIHLSIKRLGPGLFRIEVNEYLENGEYSLSPTDSNQVFCFQVY